MSENVMRTAAISVKSLGLDAEGKSVVQEVAKGGPTPDLEPDEYNAAAEALRMISPSKYQPVITRLTKAIFVGEGENLAEYWPASEKFAESVKYWLIRRDIKTGSSSAIFEDIEGCLQSKGVGPIANLITSNGDIYITFESPSNLIGKVAQKNGVDMIRFLDFDNLGFYDFHVSGISGLVVRGGKAFATGRSEDFGMAADISVEKLDTKSWDSGGCETGDIIL